MMIWADHAAAILFWQQMASDIDMTRALIAIVAALSGLIGLGTLAAGIGIFKAGWAVGQNSTRVARAFENFVAQATDRHEEAMKVAREGVGLARQIHADQTEISRTMSAIRSGMGGLWDEVNALPRGERRG